MFFLGYRHVALVKKKKKIFVPCVNTKQSLSAALISLLDTFIFMVGTHYHCVFS
jgi:hypothetical protein